VSDETLDYILEAARLAPSASNRQPWKFVVVRDEETRQQLAKASRNQRFVGEAPVVIAAVGLEPDRTMTCDVPAYAVDVSIAVDHMTLAAADKGLGTCWIGAFNQDMVRDILSIPENCKAVTIFPLGYPADEPKAKQRKDMDEIVTCERFE
jgi:nitroreductase